jgi:drug/metabolite transporter (DMT)-like permease
MAGLSRGALVAYLLTCTVWGSTYLAIRVGVEHLPPFLFAGVRFLVAGLLLGAFVLAWDLPRPANRRAYAITAATGVLFFMLGNGLVVWAEQFVPSGIASVYVVTVTIWSALVDALVPGGRSRITAGVASGLAIGFAGSLLLVGATPAEFLAADLRGPAALTIASIAWAFGTVIMKRQPSMASPFANATIQMLSGGVALTLLGLALGEAPRFVPTWPGLASLAYLIVFGSIVGFGAHAYALQHMSPSALGTYAYVNPVVAVVLGWLLLAEPITGRMIAAMALMLGAACLVQLSARSALRPESGSTPATDTASPSPAGPASPAGTGSAAGPASTRGRASRCAVERPAAS